jgi:CRP/FNR family transcriptional regulator, cyclic AMP receptor protein
MPDAVNHFKLFQNSDDVESYAPGAVVFRTGDPGECLYFVKSGVVSLTTDDRELEQVGEGGMFGEMALVDGASRSATATAITACELVPVNQRRFQFLVQQTPFFATSVMRVMAERLRRPLPPLTH